MVAQQPVSRALDKVRGDSSFRHHAQRIAAETAQAPAVDDVFDELATSQTRRR
jgi:hypothetical protein